MNDKLYLKNVLLTIRVADVWELFERITLVVIKLWRPNLVVALEEFYLHFETSQL